MKKNGAALLQLGCLASGVSRSLVGRAGWGPARLSDAGSGEQEVGGESVATRASQIQPKKSCRRPLLYAPALLRRLGRGGTRKHGISAILSLRLRRQLRAPPPSRACPAGPSPAFLGAKNEEFILCCMGVKLNYAGAIKSFSTGF